MITKAKLKHRMETPPGGYYFKDPHGREHRHTTFSGLREVARSWYRIAQIEEPKDLDTLLDEQTAKYCAAQGHHHFIEMYIESVSKQHDRLYRIDDGELLPDCNHNYNPGMVEIGDELWLVYRRHVDAGESYAVAVQLDDKYQPIKKTNKIIKLPVYHKYQTDEDPRVWFFCGQLWISWTSWNRGENGHGDWNYMPVMRVAQLDRNWNVLKQFTPEWGGNGKAIQKNWGFFDHDKELHMVYWANPHQVVRFEEDKKNLIGELVGSIPNSLSWDFGQIRGGTPPLRIGDEYLVFMHSRLGELKHGRYYMGAYYFEAKPPFKPVRMTKVPLLAGSAEDEVWDNNVLVVFPQGIVKRGDNLVVSLGVNDKFSAIYEITTQELEKKMLPISE